MSANKVPLSFRLQNGAKVDVEVELDSLVGDLKVRKGGAVVWVGAQLTLRARLLSATPCRTSWRLWYVGPRPPPPPPPKAAGEELTWFLSFFA